MVRTSSLAVGALAGMLVASPAGAQVARLEVTPNPVSIAVGERTDVVAAAWEADGDYAAVTIQWTSSNSGVVTVEVDPTASEFAVFAGVGPGSANVQVQAGGRSVTVQVTVSGAAINVPSGTGVPTVLQVEPTQVQLLQLEEIRLTPLFLKDDGSLAQATPVSFEWLGAPIGSVDASGRVTGIAPGNAVIRVTSTTNPSLSRTVSVAVQQAEWAFTRPGLSLSPAGEDTVRIVVPSQGNRMIDPRRFTWRPSNPNVAVVSPIGVVTGISGGSAEIIVSGFGQEIRLPVSVHREVTDFIVSKPSGDPVLIPLGGNARFLPRPLAADGSLVPEARVFWQVGDPAIIAYSNADSTVVGRQIGSTTLTVRYGRWTQTWTINVIPAGLVLNADRVGLSLGDPYSFEASYADSTGEPLALASDVQWQSSNPGVVQVGQDGGLRPMAVGQAQIIASTRSGGADTAMVFVQGDILFTSLRSGNPDIFAVDRDRISEPSPVLQETFQEFSPAYSPDGSRIAYVTDRDGNFEIYVANADGSDPRRLTMTIATEGAPAWTPDGRQIVYQAAAERVSHIWRMDADGSNQQQLTQGTGSNEDPEVSPDGRTIAFSSTRDGNYEIYLMNSDGSNQRNFTATPQNEIKPAWIGDTAVAFVREERQGSAATRIVFRMNMQREAAALTQRELFVRDFALSADASLLVANFETPSPQGRTSLRMMLLPLGGGDPVELPRRGDHDQLLTPNIRR